MDVRTYVGERIRTLRGAAQGGRGLSQEALGELVGATANTISRWETGVYEPSLEDLEQVSRALGVGLQDLLPAAVKESDDHARSKGLKALLRAAEFLPASDLAELERYAEFRRLRAAAPKIGLSLSKRKRRKDDAD